MAKLRMTYKNLKALRKSKEYQAMLVDLVASGVISKSKAEDLLGFNIPANLIGGTESSGTDNPIDDSSSSGSDDSSSSSGEDSSSSGSDDDDSSSSGSDDSSSSSSGDTITITVSMVKTIDTDRLSSDTVDSPSSLDSAQSIVVPAGSSGGDIFDALQAASIGDLYGISTPAFMTYDSVDHDVIGFNPDTAELFYATDTFNEDTAIGVFIYETSSSSS